LEKHLPGNWTKIWRGEVGSKGWMSVQAAITAVIANDKMSDLLRNCIAFTGDVDTVATIALGAAANCLQIEQDLPAALLGDLENGRYGRDFLIKLDQNLMNLVKR